jgi:Kef-type K+ transport system membrane component KefB
MKLTPEQLSIFLLSISLMLFSARLLGEFFEKLKQPPVIGEILAGIILGPTILGTISPQIHSWLFPRLPELELVMDGITSLAVIMLLLVVGLEVDLSLIIRNIRTAFFTSLMGMVFPFILGFSAAYLFPEFLGIKHPELRLVFALFMGTAMSISALPVITRTLMDLDIYKTEVGLIIVTSAMFDDLAGWIIFSIILGMIGIGESGLSFTEKIAFIFLFMAFMLFLGRKLINKILPYLQTKLAFPGGVLNFIFVLGFLGAALTEMMGIHAIFGAFIVGIAIGDSAHLREKTREMIQQVVTNIFAPLFFVSIGLRVNFITHFDLTLVAIIIFIAFLGKVVGCGLGAYWGGLNKNDSLAIGFGMNSRGAMEIILGLLALQSGLIRERVFVALVIMAFLTSLTSGPLIALLLRYRKKTDSKKIDYPRHGYFQS